MDMRDSRQRGAGARGASFFQPGAGVWYTSDRDSTQVREFALATCLRHSSRGLKRGICGVSAQIWVFRGSITLSATKSSTPQRVGTTPAPGWNGSRSSLELTPQPAGNKLRSGLAGVPQQAGNSPAVGWKFLLHNFLYCRHLDVPIGFKLLYSFVLLKQDYRHQTFPEGITHGTTSDYCSTNVAHPT